MTFWLALAPILLILFLMVALRWGAARSGAAGYLLTLAIAVFTFGSGIELLAYAHVKALFLTVDVLLIIWAAFLLYRVADEAGAIATIGRALPHLTSDVGMQALILGWVFATFLQGVGGFGVPVAVIAPILISLGFAPLAAVVIPSIGHGWAVTFGSLGSSFNALMAATGMPGEELASSAALLLGACGIATGWMVAHAGGSWAAVRRLTWAVIILGGVMAAVLYIVVSAGLWNLGSMAAGAAGLLLVFPIAARFRGQVNDNGKLEIRPLLVAMSGYAVLVFVILFVQLVHPVRDFLGQFVIQLPIPELRTILGHVTPPGYTRSLYVFRHTGMVLVYATVLAYLIYWRAGLYSPGAVGRIVNGTVQRVTSSSVSIASMVAMAVIMETSGMTATLALSLAAFVGVLYPLIAPWIGAIGAFMTGSNTNSNVVFAALQLRTALLLGYDAAVILAAQTAGAAVASIMAPTKVVVGASTGGMAGREGEVMRKLAVYTVLLLLLLSALAAIGVWLVN